MAKTHKILAQNFRENNAEFKYILQVFLFLFIIYNNKIAETHNTLALALARNFGERECRT
jgi:hypothetical protein